jgi:hypothetical protein
LKVTVYILTSRYGRDMGKPMCSENYLQVFDTMQKEFKNALNELDDRYEKDETSSSEFYATIVTSGDQYEWFITEQEIEVTQN